MLLGIENNDEVLIPAFTFVAPTNAVIYCGGVPHFIESEYETKSTDDIRKLIGKGAASLIGRTVWGQAKKELGKINDQVIKKM